MPKFSFLLRRLLDIFTQSTNIDEGEIRFRPFSALPQEIVFSILGYLDSISLCRAAQVSTRWKDLADDDLLWRRLCQRYGYEQKHSGTRPWKVVYRNRQVIERNWRCGRYTTRTLTGHTKKASCLQVNETLSDPSFPVLISGSYDSTIRVWNMDTGTELHCLRGHTSAVRALQFDEDKLVTGSWDHTLKVWDWRRGECTRTLNSHSTQCLTFDGDLLASGSLAMIEIWNLGTGSVFMLRGHLGFINALQLWDSNLPTTSGTTSERFRIDSTLRTPGNAGYPITSGMFLFSAANDHKIKLWDLDARTCIREFVHYCPVGALTLLLPNGRKNPEEDKEQLPPSAFLVPKHPVLLFGCRLGTLNVWITETGKHSGHPRAHSRAILAVASDKMRLLSGSYDQTIKVWSRESRECLATLNAPLECLALSGDKVAWGNIDKTIKIWDFDVGI